MLWTLKGTFDEKLATAADAGIQSVELIDEYEGWSDADAAKYKRMVTSYGMHMDTILASHDWVKRPVSLVNPAHRDAFLADIRHAIICAKKLDVQVVRRPVGEVAPYDSVAEFQADLDVLDRSLIANNARVIARGRLRLLRRAVDCFGFHLATLDMRQNSDVHERVVAELLKAVGICDDYLVLDEDARIALLERELTTLRPLSAPLAAYSEETLKELAVLRPLLRDCAAFRSITLRMLAPPRRRIWLPVVMS